MDRWFLGNTYNKDNIVTSHYISHISNPAFIVQLHELDKNGKPLNAQNISMKTEVFTVNDTEFLCDITWKDKINSNQQKDWIYRALEYHAQNNNLMPRQKKSAKINKIITILIAIIGLILFLKFGLYSSLKNIF